MSTQSTRRLTKERERERERERSTRLDLGQNESQKRANNAMNGTLWSMKKSNCLIGTNANEEEAKVQTKRRQSLSDTIETLLQLWWATNRHKMADKRLLVNRNIKDKRTFWPIFDWFLPDNFWLVCSLSLHCNGDSNCLDTLKERNIQMRKGLPSNRGPFIYLSKTQKRKFSKSIYRLAISRWKLKEPSILGQNHPSLAFELIMGKSIIIKWNLLKVGFWEERKKVKVREKETVWWQKWILRLKKEQQIKLIESNHDLITMRCKKNQWRRKREKGAI
jgi:hypothetical protein